jgi:hypothetical protein
LAIFGNFSEKGRKKNDFNRKAAKIAKKTTKTERNGGGNTGKDE